MTMELRIKRLDDRAPLPRHAKSGDAGMDLVTLEAAKVYPHETFMARTGIAAEIPEGWYGAIVPRSGIASKRCLAPVNSPGTIDSNYRGEILVPLHNFSDVTQHVEAGERICQMILQQHATVECVEVGELSETERGSDGFGSTGLTVVDLDGEVVS